jgi:(E)-4-hydroxy-3-methylbut-2-enyl-diphosphate synthase
MWKEGIACASADADALFSVRARIEELEKLGCDILRFAVPDRESADNLIRIADEVSMPLVADIHFDYKLALRCLDGNVAKIRINPGNIGSRERIQAVAEKAADRGAAIRIGVNAGSLPLDLRKQVAAGTMSRAEALAETAFRETELLEELDFHNVVVSMKASSVAETIEANEAFARRFDYPLHIGVTEAGPLIGGIVKSTLAFSRLLGEGIGSTIRVSLSSSMIDEVIAGGEILKETGKRSGGVRIVSCPRCGRNGFDVHGFVDRWQSELLSRRQDITVAVMGCVVNGPGEAQHADIGITGAGDTVIIFRKGEKVRTVSAEGADAAFREELEKL